MGSSGPSSLLLDCWPLQWLLVASASGPQCTVCRRTRHAGSMCSVPVVQIITPEWLGARSSAGSLPGTVLSRLGAPYSISPWHVLS